MAQPCSTARTGGFQYFSVGRLCFSLLSPKSSAFLVLSVYFFPEQVHLARMGRQEWEHTIAWRQAFHTRRRDLQQSLHSCSSLGSYRAKRGSATTSALKMGSGAGLIAALWCATVPGLGGPCPAAAVPAQGAPIPSSGPAPAEGGQRRSLQQKGGGRSTNPSLPPEPARPPPYLFPTHRPVPPRRPPTSLRPALRPPPSQRSVLKALRAVSVLLRAKSEESSGFVLPSRRREGGAPFCGAWQKRGGRAGSTRGCAAAALGSRNAVCCFGKLLGQPWGGWSSWAPTAVWKICSLT